jgi:hypothetical protein
MLERRESVAESLYADLVEGTLNILDACDEQANALDDARGSTSARYKIMCGAHIQ